MEDKNRKTQPFFIVLFAIVVIVVVSLFDSKLFLYGYQTEKVDLFSDILLIGAVKKVPLPEPFINDSVLINDSTAFVLRNQDPTNIIDFKKDSSSALSHFFKALRASEKKKSKVRIAYFGDSMIEGDMISQDFRSLMQDEFGGEGVGFVPITSIVSKYRRTVKHSHSNWTTYNLLKGPPKNVSLGISGYCFVPEAISINDTNDIDIGSKVKYKSTPRKHLDKFHEIKLIYGKSKTSNNSVVVNGIRYFLDGNKKVNQLQLKTEDSTIVDASFQCVTPPNIYGFSFESSHGVLVDNFSFRGNSGLANINVSKEIYSATNACLGYDLIILEYGLNAISPKVQNYGWYEYRMSKVVKHIQKSFPNTSILLMSIGDKSYRIDGKYKTDACVPNMVNAQRRIAQKNEIAFWSLYDAMGGRGSMVKWVEGDTVFAAKDYTHLNYRGANKVGEMLFSKLMTEYKDFHKHQNISAIN